MIQYAISKQPPKKIRRKYRWFNSLSSNARCYSAYVSTNNYVYNACSNGFVLFWYYSRIFI